MTAPWRTGPAEAALHEALERLHAEGDDVPCASAPELWTAEPFDVPAGYRELAAHRCQACAVRIECAAAAVEIRPSAGIWAGRNYDRRDALRAEAGQETGAA